MLILIPDSEQSPVRGHWWSGMIHDFTAYRRHTYVSSHTQHPVSASDFGYFSLAFPDINIACSNGQSFSCASFYSSTSPRRLRPVHSPIILHALLITTAPFLMISIDLDLTFHTFA